MAQEDKKKAAINKLFAGITAPTSSTPATSSADDTGNESSQESLSPRQKKYNEENERFCSLVNSELMYKVRYIATTEDMKIKEVVEIAFKKLVNEYEAECGVIRVRTAKSKKGDVSKVVNVK